jgi:hypothetical protein
MDLFLCVMSPAIGGLREVDKCVVAACLSCPGVQRVLLQRLRHCRGTSTYGIADDGSTVLDLRLEYTGISVMKRNRIPSYRKKCASMMLGKSTLTQSRRVPTEARVGTRLNVSLAIMAYLALFNH